MAAVTSVFSWGASKSFSTVGLLGGIDLSLLKLLSPAMSKVTEDQVIPMWKAKSRVPVRYTPVWLSGYKISLM